MNVMIVVLKCLKYVPLDHSFRVLSLSLSNCWSCHIGTAKNIFSNPTTEMGMTG